MSLVTQPTPIMNLLTVFLVLAAIALVASLLGFGGVAGISKDLAKWALIAAIVLAVIGFLL